MSPLKSIWLVLAVAMALAAGAPSRAAVACDDTHVDLRGGWGQARFGVVVADSDASRAQGLMFVESLPRWAGMLFAFDGPAPRRFWMKNTLIALDLLFVTPEGRVAHVHHNAIPLDLTPIGSVHDDIQFVLEINAGMAQALGIGPGSEMRHPRVIREVALWPCD